MNDKFEDVYPLTPMQRGMLFHTLYAPESGVYVAQTACTLVGEIDEAALLRAWQAVIDSNAILRSAFIWKRANEPLQVVTPKATLPVERIDLSKMASAERERTLASVVEEDRKRPFDLTKPPLMRLIAARLAPRELHLVWTRHHLVYDGWSTGILLGQVMAAYARDALGADIAAPDSPPFSSYVRWLKTQSSASLEQVWRDELAGFTRPTRLELDRGRGATRGREASFQTVEGALQPETMERVRAFAAECGITTNTIFQAAWALLLARYSGASEVVFGATSSGRSAPVPGIERMIGVFINTLPVRIAIAPSQPLPDFLKGIQARQARLRQYEHTPLTDIRRCAEVPPGEPLFESILVYENFADSDELFGPGSLMAKLGVEIVPGASTLRIDYALTLAVVPRTGKLTLAYDERRFDRTTIEGLKTTLEDALAAMTRSGARVGEVLACSAAERVAQTITWNATDRDWGELPCVHDAIAAVASAAPDAIAISSAESQLSYGELESRANGVARALRERGLPPAANVGVALDRSPAVAIAMLAILKSGCAFVLIDPNQPRGRLEYIARDAQLAYLLTDRRHAASLRDVAEAVICVDDLPVQTAAAAPQTFAHPELPAYAIYTSGSTGLPKAAVLQHRGLYNTSRALAASFGITDKSIVLQFASVGFDGCVGDVFSALISGARLCLATPESTSSASAFAELLRREAITSVTVPPSFARLVRAERVDALQVIACVGEVCPVDVVDQWQRGRRVVNGYGPTELTVAATLFDARAGDPAPPIGHPIDNARAYVLDPDRHPPPLGVAGELFLGGAGVAMGYAGRPELTAAQFVPDNIGTRAGVRLYRTGDWARRGWSGPLEYRGRADDQVKVRGFRVELGEIEARLTAHPLVHEAAVVLRQLEDGDRALAAHVVPRPGAPSGLMADLRATLAALLPHYMVPTSFVELACLPRNPSGKIDRLALAAIPVETAPSEPTAKPDEAADDIERDLTGIWCRVLRRPTIGRDDDFFKLAGGDSLLAVRMIADVEKKLGRELPVSMVFERPTIAQLAAVLRGGASGPEVAASSRGPTLDAEVRRDSLVVPAAMAEPALVLVTGATGFFGAFVVETLLRRTKAKIHCLVRAADSTDARRRLAETMERYGIGAPEMSGRIEAIRGDLALPMLGLTSHEFTALSERVDAIYHCGAHVNYLFPYERLEAPNVLGTVEVLRLASRGRAKVVHHVSTLGVFPSSQRRGRVIAESDIPVPHAAGAMGYARTKWAAEALVRQARERNIPVVIYRPADISGHSVTGASNASDMLCLTLQACLRVGLVPKENHELPIAPVDYVADALVELSLRPDSIGQVFHLNNPITLRVQQLSGHLKAIGYSIESVSAGTWLSKLREAADASGDESLRRIVGLWGADRPAAPAADFVDVPAWNCDCSAAQRGLAPTAIRCPPPDEALMRTYVRALVSSGYLPPVAGRTAE